MALKREIGFLGLLFVSIGSMIGSGWLFGALYAAKAAGPASILAWVIGALAMINIACVYAEIGAALPVPGGLARYPRLTHGYMSGLVISWIAWLAYVTVAPIEVQAVLEYAADYIPALTHTVQGEVELTPLGILSAAILLLFFCVVNWFGVKAFAETNSIIVWWKLFIPTLTIAAVLFMKFETVNFTQYGGFFPMGFKGVLTAVATSGVIMSFVGFRGAIEMGGEVKNPGKAIPFAVIGSVIICLFIYVGLQVAFIGAIGAEDLEKGWHDLAFKGISGPFASLALAVGLVWLSKILFFDALISPSGTALITTSTTSRLTYAMAEKQFFPNVFLKLNRNHVPAIGIFINFVVGLALLLPFPGWAAFVGFISAVGALSLCSGPIVLASLREQNPDLKRPFRLPFAAVLAPSAFVIATFVVYWTGWETNYKLFLTVAGGALFLFLYNRFKQGSSLNLHLRSSFWLALLLIGQVSLSYLGTFGGGRGFIPFGWDFLVVGSFSLSIYFFAVSTRLKVSDMEAV